MPGDDEFLVRFRGVRGSIPCSGPGTIRYGGNTSCLEVRCSGRLLVFDAGTGMRALSDSLGDGPIDTDLFMTHTHLDHVCGWSFLRVLNHAGTRVSVWAGHLDSPRILEDVFRYFLEDPLTPVTARSLKADITWKIFRAGDRLEPREGILIRTAPLNHPNGACGYRIEHGGKALCYVTDTEHVEGEPDRNILELIEGADMVIYDSSYTDDEFPAFVNWGHSTWQEGVRLCDAASVRTFVAFHHDPSHDDDRMDAIAAELENFRPGSVVAREGMVLVL